MEIDPDNVPDSGDIVSVCAGLVVVDHESAIVRLMHYITQEYFERTGDARTVEDDVAGQVWTFLSSTSLMCAAQVLRVPDYKYKNYSKEYPINTPLHELAHFGLATVARLYLRWNRLPSWLTPRTVTVTLPCLWQPSKGIVRW